MIPDTKHGKEFEKDCNKAFKDLYTKFNCRWERTVDSAGAGNLIRSADSDFRLLIKSAYVGCPVVIYIECKASKSGIPFQRYFRSLVKSNQNAAMKGVRRAGAVAIVLYKDELKERITSWDGALINKFYPLKRVAMEGDPLHEFDAVYLPAFAERLVSDTHSYLLSRLVEG